jgi:cadherin 5 type 2 (VE-cadherin)
MQLFLGSVLHSELLQFVFLSGRAYNISVQTLSEDEISAPTTAQYRTVPLRPLNVTFDKNSITSNSFKVHWDPPKGIR